MGFREGYRCITAGQGLVSGWEYVLFTRISERRAVGLSSGEGMSLGVFIREKADAANASLSSGVSLPG